jgi:uncharacterized membrane protein YeaQ/YmgE (transglycosylase-associated protein family)
LVAHLTTKERTMGLLGWLILGLVAGTVAKALHKGAQPGGVLGTLAVGIVGALLGGLIASAAGIGAIGSFFSLGTWLIAVAGAFLLLVAFNAFVGHGSARRGHRVRA